MVAKGSTKKAVTKKKPPPRSAARSRDAAKPSTPPPAAPASAASLPTVDQNAWRFVNRSQIAELLGTHPDTISDYTRDGMPVIERGGHGKESTYDSVACMNWWRQQQGKGAKEVAQTRSFNAQADLAEQRLRIQRKELWPKAAIVMAWQSTLKGWSIRIQSIPRRLVQLGIVSRENEHVAVTLVKEILTDIASWRALDDTSAPVNEQEDVA